MANTQQPTPPQGAQQTHAALQSAGCPPHVQNALAGFDFGTIQKIIQLATQYGPQVWEIAMALISVFKAPAPTPAPGPIQPAQQTP
jgi:hypothetical protein